MFPGDKRVPDGWEGYFDVSLGITYYHSQETGETVWAVDMGWPEVAPEESVSAASDKGSSTSHASPLRKKTDPENQSFGLLSTDENDEDNDGWAVAVDRNTGSLFRYCLQTGVRRPFVG